MATRNIEWRFVTLTGADGLKTPLEDITSFSETVTAQGAGPINTISRQPGSRLQRRGVVNYELSMETRLTNDPNAPNWQAICKAQENFRLTWQESTAKNSSDGKRYTAIDCLIMSYETSNDAEGELTATMSITCRDVQEEES